MGSRLSKIIITRQLHNSLVSLAKNSLPNESCALLVGKNKGEKVYVVDSIPMKNSDASALTFSIDPQDLINTYQKVEEQGMQVVGIFHSHPAEPLPSQTDKKFMEINPVVWLIYSTITDKYKAYVFEEKIKEVHIHHTMA
ncbi:MAG TPA: M67 family metallopeptidase [Nitrososphaeraceae archaeon]|jgi:proteasome lid subunit RPN8/RPN11